MSDAAAALAAPLTLSHKGKQYPLAPLVLDDVALFERWLENRALEAIRLRKGDIPDDDYQRLLSVWMARCVEGKFRYGGEIATHAASSADGLKFMLFLQLAKGTPAMTQHLASDILDANAAEIVALMEVANAPPLAETGAAMTLTPAAE